MERISPAVKRTLVSLSVAASFAAATLAAPQAAFAAVDPGVQGGAARAGGPLPGLTAAELDAFNDGKADFAEAEGVGDGLGPRFNLDSCGGCHIQPAIGGTSPATNPQVAIATASGAKNTVPSFITSTGPIREARFIRKADGTADGGVHSLFVISGRVDSTGNATGCTITQDNFATQVSNGNVIFRIPTPVFGGGLIEMIPDVQITDNLAANATAKSNLGISGKVNRNGNDGTIAHFGWKAQNKSLLLFSGEAYNVEMGITNELFPTEREENFNCQFANRPNDVTALDGTSAATVLSAIEKFANFMRFAAGPTRSTTAPGGSTSIANGEAVFNNIGCVLCHTKSLKTSDVATVAALRSQTVNLFSDLAVHDMGPGLADSVTQGQAQGGEFRTAPLWGLGQRIFFLHDGRTKDLITAINAHKSAANATFEASEANGVVDRFNALSDTSKQDLLNFLRSL
ncbi:MAG: di-heme oxidoredictase family protein [Sulfurifustaceae bacterium]